MSSAGHYQPTLRVIFFNLFVVLDIELTSIGKGPFSTLEADAER
jgi:hypothetical protein